ncbi:MAG: glycosyl hydrolase 115 family protein [Lachnospiraceae bacterium]|nr:glycosyl hydrolase 115 family protein [Lachnospiraceae bacterium]
MFCFNRNTIIDYSSLAALTKPVLHTVRVLERDIRKVFVPSGQPQTRILLRDGHSLPEEGWQIEISDTITLTAGDDLGFVYGLYHISEAYLGIKPFWFFLDQKIAPAEYLNLQEASYSSTKPLVRFRGWFFNDEVLLTHWSVQCDDVKPWEMAFEALLRCGGNMTIPGTDKISRKYRQLASDMGLWITHHHAEPLGAEMFTRAFPDKEPNYSDYADLFYQLWEQGVIEQKDYKVVWNLGFRGQGDCPFWSHDKSGNYNTPEKRGELISELIEKQKQLVLKHVKNPVFCTNLYGEIMELYNEGYVHFDDEIIKVYADNGYGKMVTRRRDNHCVRVAALPSNPADKSGIYYHVSFYDLQAAGHITTLPNSVDFVNNALEEVLEKGADDYWIINCSNVRPHVFYLDAIRKKWFGGSITGISHSHEFAADYYNGAEGVAECLSGYADAMLAYGENDDEHAGEQFYNENIRILINHLIRRRTDGISAFRWLTGDAPLKEQLKMLFGICHAGKEKMEAYYAQCLRVSKSLSGTEKLLFDDTVLMQAGIHTYCLRGMLMCERACNAYFEENYLNAFLDFGRSAKLYEQANQIMRDSEHGIWKGFYFNDCFADIKHTAFMLKKMMGYVRELGDNARHDKWYREAVYAVEDRQIMTQLVTDNHMTDEELWEAFMRKE